MIRFHGGAVVETLEPSVTHVVVDEHLKNQMKLKEYFEESSVQFVPMEWVMQRLAT